MGHEGDVTQVLHHPTEHFTIKVSVFQREALRQIGECLVAGGSDLSGVELVE